MHIGIQYHVGPLPHMGSVTLSPTFYCIECLAFFARDIIFVFTAVGMTNDVVIKAAFNLQVASWALATFEVISD